PGRALAAKTRASRNGAYRTGYYTGRRLRLSGCGASRRRERLKNAATADGQQIRRNARPLRRFLDSLGGSGSAASRSGLLFSEPQAAGWAATIWSGRKLNVGRQGRSVRATAHAGDRLRMLAPPPLPGLGPVRPNAQRTRTCPPGATGAPII